MFVTLEGPEGSGKSTLAKWLHKRLLCLGYRVSVTYEPGGTDLGNELRQILSHAERISLDARAETLLFCASRAQLVAEVIRPRLDAGEVVICDRYADSTLAYQSFGRGLCLESVKEAVEFATGGIWPHLTILLDLDVARGLARKRAITGKDFWDRFERAELVFHQRVRAGYLELAAADPDRWFVLDAGRPLSEVQHCLWQRIVRELTNHELTLSGIR